MKTHNSMVSALVEQATQSLNGVRTEEDIWTSLQPVREFGKPLRYEHAVHWCTALVTVCIAVWVFIGQATQRFFRWDSGIAIIGYLSVLVTVGILVLIFKRRAGINNISRQSIIIKALLDYQIWPHESKLGNVAKHIHNFREFKRGNYSRAVKYEYSTFEDAPVAFDYYMFEYVNKREETVTRTDSDGRTTTETRTYYEHFYRYGLLIDFGYFKGISIASDYVPRPKSSYKPASIAFSKHFSLGGDNMELALFLKPAVVEVVEDLYQRLRKPNIEISSNGMMCLSFADSDVLTPAIDSSLDTPEAFFEELKVNKSLPKLDAIINAYQVMLMHSDNNFE